MRSPNVIAVLPFSTCLSTHLIRRPIWIRSVSSAHSSRLAMSRNLVTASQSIHSLTNTHCSSQHQTQWTPRHEPPFLPSQAARQPGQLTQLSSSRFGTSDRPLHPCLSTVSNPSAFYVSLSPSHRNQLPLHPLHQSHTILQQIPALMRVAAPFCSILARQFNPAMHLFLSCYQPAARTTIHCSSSAHMPR